MRLRALVLGLVFSSIAAPLAVDAQRPEKLSRIGVLERTSPTINAANLDGAQGAPRLIRHVEVK
jgi:hypothetical protein